MASAVSFEWDASEEKARERRIAERRERVQERLRQQQQQRERAAGGAAPPPPPAPQLSKGQAAAAAGAEAVSAAHEAAATEVEAVRRGAEERTDAHREACDAEEAALREQVAAEAEASRRECRAIDLEWERLQGVAAPQALAAGIAAAAQRCAGVLGSKAGVLGAARALLARRDDQYARLLRDQGEESDGLIAAMHGAHARCRAAQEAALEATEAAYLQERAEAAAARKAELEALLEQRSAMEQEFMEQYLAACEACEAELEGLRAAGAQQHADLKRRLEGEVAALEAHLDGLRASTGLAADRLDYSCRVLVEREKESKEALLHQKRRITRQWEVLARLKKRYAAADARAAADNARLSDEYQGVTRAFAHLQRKVRHFKAADLARFEQVRAMKEGELEGLLGSLLEAQALIAAYAAGPPPPPPASAAATESAAGSGSAADGVEADEGSAEGGSPELDLAVVGTALPPGALAAGAAEAVAFGPGEAPAEVVAVPGGEAAQLIPAYRPAAAGQEGQDDVPATSAAAASAPAGPAHLPRRRSVDGMDALAWSELSASVDSGALSLALPSSGGSGGGQASQQLQQLVAQVPAAGPEDDGVTADAVARSLGLHQRATVATLRLLFGGSQRLELPGPAIELAQTVGARGAEAAAEAGNAEAGDADAGSASSDGSSCGAAAKPVPVFSRAQVEQGLARLLRLLAPEAPTPAVVDGASDAASTAQAQPTSKLFWQARVDATLPPGVARAWQLLERQAGQQLATLQARAGAADEVLALRRENEQLKATLADLLNSPLNKGPGALQLPPTLLLK